MNEKIDQKKIVRTFSKTKESYFRNDIFNGRKIKREKERKNQSPQESIWKINE